MRVLVTGGTGVVGHGLIPQLQAAGHRVRLLTRHAERDAGKWKGVEPWEADVRDTFQIHGAADGCGAVVHATGVAHAPDAGTLDSINVLGTRRMLDEAERARVRRFVFVSSLGAGTGTSDYHRAKRRAEALVRGFSGSWVVLRPGNVYGPGDHVVSELLRVVRALPIVPVVGGGKRFQPIWCEDLGAAIAQLVDRDDVSGVTLDLAGSDVITIDELLERLETLTSRDPKHLHLPDRVASLGTKLIETLGLDASLARATGVELPHTAQLTMLEEENSIPPEGSNALTDVFGITPTPLAEGLRRLALEMPEQLPDEGVGALERKRFWARIEGSPHDASELMRIFRAEAKQLLPLEFADEEGPSPQTASLPIEVDQTLTLRLPARGEIQVRVEEANDRAVTFATVAGHPLAGVVRFGVEPAGNDLLFQIDVFARPANVLDQLAMKAGGQAMQSSAWEKGVAAVVERSGGTAPDGVQHTREALAEGEARRVEEWILGLVQRRQREGRSGPRAVQRRTRRARRGSGRT